MFSGHCDRAPGVIPAHPNCEQCDSTSNIFLAKTQPVIQVYNIEQQLSETGVSVRVGWCSYRYQGQGWRNGGSHMHRCIKNIQATFDAPQLNSPSPFQIGGWSPELKIAEHADFFVKVKGAGLKVIYCDDIEVSRNQSKPVILVT